MFHDQNGSVYGPGFMTAEIPLLGDGEKRVLTFYNQHGDVFGWTCVGITAVMMIGRILLWRKVKRAEKV